MGGWTIKRSVREVKGVRSMQNELCVFLLIVGGTGALSVLEPHFMGYSSKDLFQIKRAIDKAYL